jgi:hypothetical protein
VTSSEAAILQAKRRLYGTEITFEMSEGSRTLMFAEILRIARSETGCAVITTWFNEDIVTLDDYEYVVRQHLSVVRQLECLAGCNLTPDPSTLEPKQ